jgi:RNA ligase
VVLPNYTDKAQYESVWTAETMACRGLVIDDNGEIVARPFRKFFNLSEHSADNAKGAVPIGERFEALEKLDGTLIVLSNYRGHLVINTRGEFDNKYTHAARRLGGGCIPVAGVTWCAELIGPQYRVVVPYSDDSLVFLAAISNETGVDSHFTPQQWPHRWARRYDATGIEELIRSVRDDGNFEGWVIRFESGLRVKVKLPEYLRIHKLISHCSNISIWELLRAGGTIDELISRVPDEFYKYVTDTAAQLRTDHCGILMAAHTAAEQARSLPTRKEQAASIIASGANTAVAFLMLDGRDAADAAWRAVRPTHEKPSPFTVEAP